MKTSLLHRPIAVTMIIIAIVTLGILALGKIPVSLMPDIDIPRITIQMTSPGASAREVEQGMVGPMRQQLSQVVGLKDIESTSQIDGGTITMSFEPGSDMSLTFIEVNEKIDRAMGSMPKEMERPKVMKIGALDIPAFYIDISSHKESVPLHQMSRLVKNVISKRIEQLPEVAMVDMSGTVGSQIVIQPDVGKMATLGLVNEDIESAVNDNNIVLEALSVRDGIYRYSIHFDSQILSVEDIENIYLRHEGRLLQLKDICEVIETPSVRNAIVRNKGMDAITMAIIKQNDAQMEDLQSSILELMDELHTDYPDLDIEITRDQTQLLSYSMTNLKWNLVLGAVMACIVLFLFLGGWRLPLLVTISIPLSLILTLQCFYLMGVSLNIISLSGLILGVGMIVDNAIIVIDNIGQKYSLKKAANGVLEDTVVVDATREVFLPMLSSVLTTCAVFIPLIFLSGTAGALFYDQAMGVTIALFASLFVAAMVVPVYYYTMYRSSCGKCGAGYNKLMSRLHIVSSDRSKKPNGSIQYLLNRNLLRWYERTMNFTFRNAKWIFAAFGVCVVLIFVLYPYMRKERVPAITHDDSLMYIDWNTGVSAEENDRRVQEVMNQVSQSTAAYTTMAGNQEFMLSHTRTITSDEAVCYIKTVSAGSLDSVQTAVKNYLSRHYPNANVEFSVAANVFDMIFSTDRPDLEVRLRLKEGGRPSVALASAINDSLMHRFPNLGIQPLSTEENLCFTVDVEQLAYYGLTYQQLYGRLKQLMNRNNIYEISSGGESVPVVIGAGSHDAENILCQQITNAAGVNIPLEYIVTPSKGEDYKRLSAGTEGEYVPIRIEDVTDGEVKEVMEYVKSLEDDKLLIERFDLERNRQASLESVFIGDYFDSKELVGELCVVMAVAVLLLYFILAAQFENLIHPFIILTEIAIDVCIVMILLSIMGESLNLMSMIGLVVMSGIVINDSILKIDTINGLYRSGMPLIRSVITAGHRRLKPIVMTSLTTILALVPFLSKNDMGSALQFPLSLTLVIGMTVGTFVSLFFVPLVYWIITRAMQTGLPKRNHSDR